LRKDRIRELRERLSGQLGPLAEMLGKRVEIWEVHGQQLVWSEGEPVLIVGERLIPTLRVVERIALPRVVVDMGAVGPVCRGADVMAPGVKRVHGPVRAGELVLVVDERHGKALAVGEALVSSEQMTGRRGRVIRNLHYVGDKFWKLFHS
jgi:PUA domain protein